MGPRRKVASGARRSPKGPYSLLSKGLSSLKGPTGDRVLIGAPNASKELSSLQEASYVYQENSLRRLPMGGQKVLAGSLLSLTGAFMSRRAGGLPFPEMGALRQGAPSYGVLRGAHCLQRGHLLFIKDRIDSSRSRVLGIRS